MKIRTTQKYIKNNYKNIIEVGYSDLAHLLRYEEPLYNTSGAYGWDADIYQINYNTVIVTGYRPFGNISNYDLVRKYEEKARKIDDDYNMEYNKKTQKLERLLQKFIDEILKEKE